MTSVKAETPIMCILVSCSLSGGQRSVQQAKFCFFSDDLIKVTLWSVGRVFGCVALMETAVPNDAKGKRNRPQHTLTVIARELSQRQEKKSQERFQHFQLPASQTSFNWTTSVIQISHVWFHRFSMTRSRGVRAPLALSCCSRSVTEPVKAFSTPFTSPALFQSWNLGMWMMRAAAL